MTKGRQMQLEEDVALVLFEFLARFDETEQLAFEDASEKWALIQLHGELERTLVEPFKPDYQALLRAARSRIRQRAGVE
jgi:hypothetical protein